MTFESLLPKGSAELLGNAVRRIAMTSIPCWRPIAFGFDGMQMNMLHIDPLIAEDTPAVLSNLSDLDVIPLRPIAGPYKAVKFTFKGDLTARDMSNEDFRFERKGNYPIVTSIDRNRITTLTVVFKFASGGFTSRENSALTSEDIGMSVDGFVFLSSRHTEIDNFTYEVVDSGVREEKLIMNISSKSKDPQEILQDSLQNVESLFNTFKQNLNKIAT